MNKVESWLVAAGKDFVHGLGEVLPYAETAGEAAVSLYAPALGPLFNQTVSAVVTAEQKYAALGRQSGSGASKLADVVTIMGPLIAQALNVAGKSNETAAVQGYINSVVTILNAVPAPQS